MNTRKVADEYRLTQWAQLVQTRLTRGQKIEDFCQEMGINKNVYFYWQRKVRQVACTELVKMEETKHETPSRWMQLKQEVEEYGKKSFAIEISGCHITVNVDTDLELLKRVCQMLRSL